MEEEKSKLLTNIVKYLDISDQLSSLNNKIQELEANYHSSINNIPILNPTLKVDLPTLVEVAGKYART